LHQSKPKTKNQKRDAARRAASLFWFLYPNKTGDIYKFAIAITGEDIHCH
jgi:hypothetical protein